MWAGNSIVQICRNYIRTRNITKQDIELCVTIVALIANVIALWYVAGSINQNSDIIGKLGDQVKLQRANLVKSYLDFKPDFSITFPSFYPLGENNPSFPIKVTNRSKYLTKTEVWIYSQEICLHNEGVSSAYVGDGRGMTQILESNQTVSMEIPIIDIYAGELEKFDSVIVKVIIISTPYDRTVESIYELEKPQHFYIQYEKLPSLNGFFPIFVENGKIKCPGAGNYNDKVTVSTPNDWIYLGYEDPIKTSN